MHKPTQKERILETLQKADGEWVNGREFLHKMYLSQYHSRIKELEEEGYNIQHSPFTDSFNFKSYRLVEKNVTMPLL